MICRVLLVLLLVAPPALAGPSAREQARDLLRAGNQLHDRGDYLEALQEYRRARDLYPTFKIDFNIGVTLEAMGRTIEAAEQFERFLRQAATAADSAIVTSARERLAGLRLRLASTRVRCTVGGATIRINGASIGRTPLEGRIYLRPGTHRVTLSAEGHEAFERVLVLEAGDHPSLVVTLLVAPPTRRSPPALRPAPAPAVPVYKRWWFWTLIGAVVAGGVAGVAGGVVAGTRHGSDRVPVGELGTLP